jgi:uncharacterized glyoxalase superfamily protein PhnB
VTPYVIVPRAEEFLHFIGKAFGAHTTEITRPRPGSIHGEARVGEAMLMVGSAEGAGYERRASLHYFVEDVDASFEQALAAGATLLMGETGKPADRPYGERSAFLEDPWGNHWFVAKHLHGGGEKTGEITPYLYPSDARALMDFLEKAFGAEKLGVFENAGKVAHAAVRLGDSLVEMGEADRFPQAIYLYVPDPDEAYRKALAAGATSLWEPADHPYGERHGGVRDPFGNEWYPAKTLS